MKHIVEQPQASAAIDMLLDEVIRLCANFDEPLAIRLEIILRRSSAPATNQDISPEPFSAITALRMLVYLRQEDKADLAIQFDQIDSCIHEIIDWYRRKYDLIIHAAPPTSLLRQFIF